MYLVIVRSTDEAARAEAEVLQQEPNFPRPLFSLPRHKQAKITRRDARDSPASNPTRLVQ